MQPVYILSGSAVSPQQHFEEEGFLHDLKYTDDGKLYVTHPNYRNYINPVAIRRMSKLLKMGISTGMRALQEAAIETPDAIVTGTGRGSMVDMEQFLLDMIKHEEEALTPTAFIQSTYNSVNGWLALNTKCKGYNQTFVNRGHSFELALLDAQLLLNEVIEKQIVLAGCFDEITDDYVRVKSKIGYWKKPLPKNSLNLFDYKNINGTIAGEGAAFFTLCNQPEKAICKLSTIKMLQDADTATINAKIEAVLSANSLKHEDVDILLCGTNGDVEQHSIYANVIEQFSDNTTIARFKHLCGEYDTSTGFAAWLTTELFKHQNISDTLIQRAGSSKDISNILLVNSYILNSTSILLFQSVLYKK